MSNVLDDIELKSVCLLAEELNERIQKTKDYMDKDVKTSFKFQRAPSIKAEQNLIGRLEIGVTRSPRDEPHSDRSRSEYLRTLSIMSPLPSQPSKSTKSDRSKTMHFKLPYKCKSMFLAALSNKAIVKVIESVVIDEYSYVLNLSLVNNFESSKSSARLKASEDIGPFRLKKVQTSMCNNYILVHLVNKFLTSLNHFKLYNAELACVKSLDVNYKPVEIFMNKKGIYVLSVSDANKSHLNVYRYDYELHELECFTFVQYAKLSNVNQQEKLPPRRFNVDKNLKLVGVESEKFYFLDSDKNRVSILSKDGGVKWVKIGEEYENERKEILLIRVDGTERINVLNRKLYKVEAFNESGQIVTDSKLDTRIQSIDSFFVFEADKSYCVIDRKNCVVNFT
jgi:hypothetical protein